jgi:hypothetical protein
VPHTPLTVNRYVAAERRLRGDETSLARFPDRHPRVTGLSRADHRAAL